MSYLIALYVYYHGNNLVAFGIIKGLKPEANNDGMYHKTAEEINPYLVDPTLIQAVKDQEKQEKMPTYEDILRKAMKQSQQNSYQLHQKGMSINDVLANTPDPIIDESDNMGHIDLDFFDEINPYRG